MRAGEPSSNVEVIKPRSGALYLDIIIISINDND